MKFKDWKKKNITIVMDLENYCADQGVDEEFRSIIQSAFYAGVNSKHNDLKRIRKESNNHAHVLWEFSEFPVVDGPCEPDCEMCIAVAKAMDAADCIQEYPEHIWWEDKS